MEKSCWTCRFILDLGKVQVCLKWRCEINPNPDVNLFCEKWKKDDEIYDLYDHVALDLGKQENNPLVPRKE